MATAEIQAEGKTAGSGEQRSDPHEAVALVQELQERFERCEDSEAKRSGEALIGALVQMYGGGLAQLVRLLSESDGAQERLRAALECDPLLATLLLIHDLHPATLEERVAEALEQVRPYMESHGGNVELRSLQGGVARIRLQGSCSDCAASAVTLELAIKQALEEYAPDIESLEVEGVAGPPPAAAGALPIYHASAPTADAAGGGAVVLPMAGAHTAAPSAPPTPPSWAPVEGIGNLADGEMVVAEVAESTLLVANVGGTLLAYRDICAGCGAALHDGVLEDGALRCAECARTFFLPRAGRSLDDERVQLEPVPLLADAGGVRVALAR